MLCDIAAGVVEQFVAVHERRLGTGLGAGVWVRVRVKVPGAGVGRLQPSHPCHFGESYPPPHLLR